LGFLQSYGIHWMYKRLEREGMIASACSNGRSCYSLTIKRAKREMTSGS
jgi:hypothetical protein